MTLEDATGIARVLGSPIDEVLFNAGVSTERVRGSKDDLKVSGWIDSESLVHGREGLKGPTTAPHPGFGGKDLLVLRFQTLGNNLGSGGGNNLEGFDGGLAYFNKSIEGPGAFIGRFSRIKIESGGSSRSSEGREGKEVVGVLKRGYRAGSFSATHINGRIMFEDLNVEGAAACLWLKL